MVWFTFSIDLGEVGRGEIGEGVSGAMRKLDEAGRDHGRPLRGGEGGDFERRREKEKRAGSNQARGIPGGSRCREVGGEGPWNFT